MKANEHTTQGSLCHSLYLLERGQWTEAAQLSDEKVSFYSHKTWQYASIRTTTPADTWTSSLICRSPFTQEA